MKETGQLLKNRRIEKNYSLQEISSQTKIQLSILQSLEEGQIENLKNKTYIKGFLRQYAKALQLDPEEVIRVFEQENNTNPAVVEPVNKLKAEEPIEEKTNVLWFRAPAKMITFGGVIVIGTLAGAVYLLSQKMASYSEETFKEPVTVESEETEFESAQDPEMTETAVAPTPKSEEKKPEPVKATEKVEEKKAEKKPEPKPEVKKEEPKPEVKAEEAKVEEKKPEPAKKPLNKEVIINASENISIEASWSTGQKETVQIKANAKHTFYYPKQITLQISNAGAANITANGEKMGVPGEPGQPVTLSFE